MNLLGVVTPPALQVGITDVSVAENAGSGQVFALVSRRNTDISSDLTVNLTSSQPSRVILPSTAVIVAGDEFVLVPLDFIDNAIVGDTTAVAVSAEAAGFEAGVDQVVVLDDDTAPTLNSFARQVPFRSPTNADTLVFRATFDRAVVNVNEADFAVTGTTAHGRCGGGRGRFERITI